MLEREEQRLRMRLSIRSVAAADAGGEQTHQTKRAELTEDAVAIAAGDQAELMAASESGEDAPGAEHEFRTVTRVLSAPRAVGIIPAVAGNFCGGVDPVPVRRIVEGEFFESPIDTHFAKHREISGGIRLVGIEKGSVPIKEDAVDGVRFASGHWS